MIASPPAPADRGRTLVRHGCEVAMEVEGRPVEGLAGESLMAALLRAGHWRFRHARDGAWRAPFCGTGVCHDCLVEVDGRRGQRACLAKVADGLRVRPHEELAPVAAPLGTLPGSAREREVPFLIVGAGPAGLAAAAVAAEHGLSVLLLDERSQPGGQYLKQPSPPHRFRGAAPDAQYAAGEALIGRARRAGAELVGDALVWGARPLGGEGAELEALVAGQPWRVRARTLLLATGALERAWPVPGWTLPGVMTTGCGQTLLRAERTFPPGRVVIAGHGPLNLQLAHELLRSGRPVVAAVELGAPTAITGAAATAAMLRASPGLVLEGLRHLAALKTAGVPLLERHVLVRVEGGERAEAAIVAPVGPDGTVSGAERRLPTDLVCLNYGFQPADELARLLGCDLDPDPATGVPLVRREVEGATSVSGVHVAGDGGAVAGARAALAEGQLAAFAALRRHGVPVPTGAAAPGADLVRALRFQRALWRLFAAPAVEPLRLGAGDRVVCRCEGVRLAELRPHLADRPDLGVLKRLTRAGMGRCQGRYCAPLLARLAAEIGDPGFTPQRPVRPVPAVLLAREHGEWRGHPAVTPPRLAPVVADAEPAADLRAEVAVVGGGILGVATALALTERGVDTVLVERGRPNAQASGGNAGSLHVQLLAYDLEDRERIAAQPPASLLPLQRHAVAAWRELAGTLDTDLELEVTGGLMLAETGEQLRFLERKAAVERANGIEVAVIGREELRRLFPDVAPGVVGASWCPGEGRINPLLATPALLGAARARDLRLLRDAELLAVEDAAPGFLLRTTSRDGTRRPPRRRRRRLGGRGRGHGGRAPAGPRGAAPDAGDRGGGAARPPPRGARRPAPDDEAGAHRPADRRRRLERRPASRHRPPDHAEREHRGQPLGGAARPAGARRPPPAARLGEPERHDRRRPRAGGGAGPAGLLGARDSQRLHQRSAAGPHRGGPAARPPGGSRPSAVRARPIWLSGPWTRVPRGRALGERKG